MLLLLTAILAVSAWARALGAVLGMGGGDLKDVSRLLILIHIATGLILAWDLRVVLLLSVAVLSELLDFLSPDWRFELHAE